MENRVEGEGQASPQILGLFPRGLLKLVVPSVGHVGFSRSEGSAQLQMTVLPGRQAEFYGVTQGFPTWMA